MGNYSRGIDNKMKQERVQKLLAQAGVASRRKAEDLISQGKITVNGVVAKIGDTATWSDKITYNGEVVSKPSYYYVMFHKPKHVMSSMADPLYDDTLDKYLPPKYLNSGVTHVGRLDNDAEGLLLLTNDGDFANRITHPRYQIPKTYMVWTKEPISKKEIKRLQDGIEIEGRIIYSAVNVILPTQIELTIHVGIHKIVKRLLKAVGHRVIRLKRIAISDIYLGNLKPGSHRELKKSVVDNLILKLNSN